MMTEQDAIKEIVREICEGCYGADNTDIGMCSRCGYKIAIDALELQTPKEPINQQGDPLFGYCPNCGFAVYKWLNRVGCKECLQRLKWNDE